jgi:hypothetical protein
VRPPVADLRDRLGLLFVLGVVLLNAPVLGIFNRHVAINEVPLLYVYVFGVWLAGILSVFALARQNWDDEEDREL